MLILLVLIGNHDEMPQVKEHELVRINTNQLMENARNNILLKC